MGESMNIKDRILEVRRQVQEDLAVLRDSKSVYEAKKKIMDGKTGIVGALMREMGKIAKEDRAEFGRAVNELKDWTEARFAQLNEEFKQRELEARYEAEKIDVTLPPKKIRPGSLHPITLVTNELIDIFSSMGFEIYEGTEIETDFYNFTALNIPEDHPARDMQDTFSGRRPARGRSTSWSAGHCRSRSFPPARSSVRTTMRRIPRCSPRWKDWSWTKASRSEIFRAC